MLQALHIRDLALIEHAEVRFAPGLNVISGETGGGKSLIVTALKLLRGGRASAEAIRHGATELRVDAEFLLGEGERSAAVTGCLAEVGAAPAEDGVVILTRIVDSGGRSRVRINDRPATLSALRALGRWLLEIHGQGDARALMRPEIQSETLDAFAGLGKLRGQFAAALAAARDVRSRLRDAAGAVRDRLSRLEFLRFQAAEMEAVQLAEGEAERLDGEHRVLAHLDAMREKLELSIAALQESEPSAGELLARAVRALDEASAIDPRIGEARDLAAEAEVLIADSCRAAQSRLAGLDLDPGRLDEVEQRLAVVRRALSRFGPTETDFFATLAETRSELEELAATADDPAELERDLRDRTAELDRLARRLIRARAKAGTALSAAIETELAALGMPDTRFRVDQAPLDPDADLIETATVHGPTPVDFEVRINPGEPFRSMKQTASGGEMARIVLAVKKSLADQDRVPFVAFDEIDAEIGGRLGLEVGAKLRDVAAHHQVLIVTHLPQVAAFAEAHFRVDKSVRSGRTVTRIEHLDASAVERELAAMATGEGGAEALREARRLVARARREQGA